MEIYIIEPLVRVGVIRLGMTPDAVRKAMSDEPKPFRKTAHDVHDTDAFHEGALQVFYAGEPPTVEYIELSRVRDLRAVVLDLSIFETPAEELVAQLGRLHDFESDDDSAPFDVIFPDLQMSLWRPHPPASSNDENARYFSTVGIGVHGYFS
jgi:hypothetical protein